MNDSVTGANRIRKSVSTTGGNMRKGQEDDDELKLKGKETFSKVVVYLRKSVIYLFIPLQ